MNELLKKEIGIESMSLRLFLGNALSPYEISNAEADRIVERLDLSEKRILEILSRQSSPPWETPEQYKERTGEEYPDDGPVWVLTKEGLDPPQEDWGLQIFSEINKWKSIRRYENSRLGIHNENDIILQSTCVIIANHHGKPKPDWRPE